MKIFTAPFRFILAVIPLPTLAFAQADALPSWNDGPAKQAIVAFVAKVTKQGSTDFVPVAAAIDKSWKPGDIEKVK